jgi:hypothetical protein
MAAAMASTDGSSSTTRMVPSRGLSKWAEFIR